MIFKRNFMEKKELTFLNKDDYYAYIGALFDLLDTENAERIDFNLFKVALGSMGYNVRNADFESTNVIDTGVTKELFVKYFIKYSGIGDTKADLQATLKSIVNENGKITIDSFIKANDECKLGFSETEINHIFRSISPQQKDEFEIDEIVSLFSCGNIVM